MAGPRDRRAASWAASSAPGWPRVSPARAAAARPCTAPPRFPGCSAPARSSAHRKLSGPSLPTLPGSAPSGPRRGFPAPAAPPRVSSRGNTTTREIQGPSRPARLRTGPGAHQRTRLARQPRVEFPREIGTSGFQDLISAAELPVFLLQLRDPLLITGRGPGPRSAVDFRLLCPGPQRLRMNPQLTRDPGQFPVPLALSFPDLEQHPHRAFAQLIRVLLLCRHDPASSQESEPPRFPGWPTPSPRCNCGDQSGNGDYSAGYVVACVGGVPQC